MQKTRTLEDPGQGCGGIFVFYEENMGGNGAIVASKEAWNEGVLLLFVNVLVFQNTVSFKEAWREKPASNHYPVSENLTKQLEPKRKFQI